MHDEETGYGTNEVIIIDSEKRKHSAESDLKRYKVHVIQNTNLSKKEIKQMMQSSSDESSNQLAQKTAIPNSSSKIDMTLLFNASSIDQQNKPAPAPSSKIDMTLPFNASSIIQKVYSTPKIQNIASPKMESPKITKPGFPRKSLGTRDELLLKKNQLQAHFQNLTAELQSKNLISSTDTLVSWLSVVKEYWPGSWTHLKQKDRDVLFNCSKQFLKQNMPSSLFKELGIETSGFEEFIMLESYGVEMCEFYLDRVENEKGAKVDVKRKIVDYNEDKDVVKRVKKNVEKTDSNNDKSKSVIDLTENSPIVKPKVLKETEVMKPIVEKQKNPTESKPAVPLNSVNYSIYPIHI